MALYREGGIPPTEEELVRRVAAEGRLPVGARGQRAAREALACVTEAMSELSKRVDPATATKIQLERQVDGAVLKATALQMLDQAQAPHLVILTASKAMKPRERLRGWLLGLLATACGLTPKFVLIGGNGNVELTVPTDPAAALDGLANVLNLYREIRHHPVLLFENLSPAIAEQRCKHPDSSADELLSDAYEAWDGREENRHSQDRHNSFVHALFGDLEHEDLFPHAKGLVTQANRLWAPVFAASNAKRSSEKGGQR